MAEREKIKGKMQRMVACRKTKPVAFRALEKCEQCPLFGGREEISPEQNGYPAQYAVICSLPSRVEVKNLIIEG